MERKPMKVPLFNYSKTFKAFRQEIDLEISKTIESGVFINGESLGLFEEELSKFLGSENVIGMSSGTDSLLAIFAALGLKPKDKILVTPFTFVSSASSIQRAGLKPVFVDISENNFYPELEQIEKAYSKDVKAILLVHLFGEPVNLSKIKKFCDDNEIIIIEDCAQSLGSCYKSGKQTGTVGVAGAFSFFPTKNLGCFGDGGAICTDDHDLVKKIKVIKNHGCAKKYFPETMGFNFRLDTLQASILRVMLRNLKETLYLREQSAKKYLAGFAHIQEIKLPQDSKGRTWNQFTIRTKDRDELKKFLDFKKIGNAIYYPQSLNKSKLFNSSMRMENSETACNEVISIPIYPNITDIELSYVIESIRKFYNV
jgi:UDP-2-acetamido-2-deoxy-ribo-hexuluronate aminotransferase